MRARVSVLVLIAVKRYGFTANGVPLLPAASESTTQAL